MANVDSASKEGRSWRALDQTVNPRTLSSQGRRRFALVLGQAAVAALMLAGLAWAGWEIGGTLAGDTSPLSDPVNAAPLREIVLINDADGVLSQEWIEHTLAVRPGSPLLEIDLLRLREKLLAVGQVRAVELRRDFPGTLVVALHERVPVLRVQLQAGTGAPQTWFVARDGVLYEGIGYDNARVGALPWLDGVRLVRRSRGAGFHPVEGMEDVATLLQVVQNTAPRLFNEWKTVSLARLLAYDEIVVKTRKIPEVVFSRKIDFNQQLARLDYIASYAGSEPDTVVQRVDLSLGGNVPVSLAHPDSKLLPPSLVKPSNSKARRDL